MAVVTTDSPAIDAHRLALRGAYDEALPLYRLALEQGQSADLLSSTGFVCTKLGLAEVAETYLQRALDLDGGHIGALKNLAELLLTQPTPSSRLDIVLDHALELYPGEHLATAQ